jgi:hypothetical protein
VLSGWLAHALPAGDVRAFYNEVFMPLVEKFVRSALLKQSQEPRQGCSQEQQAAAATAVAQAATRAAAANPSGAPSQAAVPSPPAAQPLLQLLPLPPTSLAIQAAVEAMDVDVGGSVQQRRQQQQQQRPQQVTPRSSIGALAKAAGAAAAAARSASPRAAAASSSHPAASGTAGSPAAHVDASLNPSSTPLLGPSSRLKVRPDSPPEGLAAAAATASAAAPLANGQALGALPAAGSFRSPAGQLPAGSHPHQHSSGITGKENQLQPGSGGGRGAGLGAAGAAAGKLLLSGALGLLGRAAPGSSSKARGVARGAGYQPSRFMAPGQQAALLHQRFQQPQGSQPMEVDCGSPAAGQRGGLGPLGAGAAGAGRGSFSPVAVPFALHSIAEEMQQQQQQQRRPLAGLSPAQVNMFRSFR